jgi:hypothetical protein
VATRFIQSLLARFQIVFVGYTADDPPVQYLLEQWATDSQTRWRERVMPFFANVWPKQRALRTPTISARLADFLLASGDLMPALLPLILPRLVPIRGGPLRMNLIGSDADDPVEYFPAAVLDVLWAILSEDPAYWPYKTEHVLDRLAATPATTGDSRLSELRRRRDR